MKAIGIVAEYNPFHRGHAFQIEYAREKLGADIIIVVMSGNFLQRGEPALVDKWIRTKMALAGGADLIVELPLRYSIQPADFFAEGAIKLLGDLGIDGLCFGVESGSDTDYLQAASAMLRYEKKIGAAISQSADPKVPYAKQMEEALYEVVPDFSVDLQSPNNHLGFAYAKEVVRQGFGEQIELFPLKREKATYHEVKLVEQQNIASATAIRQAIFEERAFEKYIPEMPYTFLADYLDVSVNWENYFPYLKYQLQVQTPAQLREIYQMTEGLEFRLKEFIVDATSFEDFMGKIKTKRYTRTRLQRLLTYVLLQIKNDEMHAKLKIDVPIRLLGFNPKGQAYLNSQKHDLSSELIANINQQTKDDLSLEIKAGEIYRMGHKSIKKQDFTRHPVKFD